MVESSFNLMGDIMDPRSTSMYISTFSAIQTVKYTLMSRKQSAVEMFSRDDARYGAVDKSLCRNVITAGRDKAQRLIKLHKARERKMELQCQPTTSTVAGIRKQVVEAENLARKGHIAKQCKRAIQGLAQRTSQRSVVLHRQHGGQTSIHTFSSSAPPSHPGSLLWFLLQVGADLLGSPLVL